MLAYNGRTSSETTGALQQTSLCDAPLSKPQQTLPQTTLFMFDRQSTNVIRYMQQDKATFLQIQNIVAHTVHCIFARHVTAETHHCTTDTNPAALKDNHKHLQHVKADVPTQSPVAATFEPLSSSLRSTSSHSSTSCTTAGSTKTSNEEPQKQTLLVT